ncbi:hypothetical protein ES703_100257 [subsurface metagenome]
MAKNAGVVDALERNLRVKLKTFPDGVDPQMMGGIGAAVIAKEMYLKRNL